MKHNRDSTDLILGFFCAILKVEINGNTFENPEGASSLKFFYGKSSQEKFCRIQTFSDTKILQTFPDSKVPDS